MTDLTRGERIIELIDWALRVIGVASLVVSLILVSQMFEQAERERRQNACQAEINAAQSRRAINLDDDIRIERNTERRADDALTALVEGLLISPPQEPSATRTQISSLRDALEAQRTARAAADRARNANPPIPVPEC